MDPRIAEKLEKLSKFNVDKDYFEVLKICLDIISVNPAQHQANAVVKSIVCQKYPTLIKNNEGLLNFYFDKILDLYNPPLIEYTMWCFHKKQFDKLEPAINKFSSKEIKINSLDLVKLDPYVHEPEFPRIFKLLQPFIVIQDLDDPSVIYRLAKNYLVCDSISTDNFVFNNLEKNKIKINSLDLIKLEPYTNDPEFPVLFKSFKPFIAPPARDTLKDLSSIYALAKVSYAGNDTIGSQEYMNKINDRIDPNESKVNSLFYYGFGSLSKAQPEKAKAYFDRVFIFASEKEVEYIKGELKWWGSRGFKQKEIGQMTSVTFDNIPAKEITKKEINELSVKQETIIKPVIKNVNNSIRLLRPSSMKRENLVVFNNLYIIAGYLVDDGSVLIKVNNK
jgi:hypothetical protein